MSPSKRAGIQTDMAKKMERENRELRQANRILRKASVYFALIEGNAALLRASPEMLDRQSK